MIYSAKLDTNGKVTTAVVFLILFSVAFGLLSLADSAPSGAKIVLYFVMVLFVALLVAGYLYSPHHYEITEDAFIIHRRLGSVVVRFSEMISVDHLNPSFVRDMKRTGGNGGAFGYYGEFTAGRDIYRLYITQVRNTVLIITKAGNRLVISPDDLSIVSRIREKIGGMVR